MSSLFKLPGIIAKRPLAPSHFMKLEAGRVNLKAVKSIVASYDPFSDNSGSIRLFLHRIHCAKVRKTNLDLKIKTEISCVRTEPTIAFELITGNRVLFKTAHLSELEMLQLYNKHITPHGPVEDKSRETLGTKAMKKKAY